ncbi:MAG: efflux RND transporter permease subunit, partial [Muribaculaceae bacterium]|nr:efflux RND transporter permease subunit [Muribaculaceae bacterium]
MLNKIIKFSLHNRLMVLVGAVLLIVAGIFAVKKTEVDVFPDLNAPTVVVMTEANGMAPDEVERLVTFPIETAVNGASGVRRVRSASSTGFSVVWVEFDWGTDILSDRQIVSEKLSAIAGELPSNVGQPTLGPQSSILGELLIIGLTSDSIPMLELRTIAERTIRPRLLSVEGVSQVSVIGGDLKEYCILLNPDKMRHYGVTLSEVLDASRGIGANASGGVTYSHGNEYIIRGAAPPDIEEAIAKSTVKTV